MSATEPPHAEALRTEIEQTRADLAATVDALGAKLDVKARATEARQAVSGLAAKAKEAAPAPVQQALDRAGSAVAPAAARAKPYRRQIVLGVIGAVVVAVVIQRTRRTT